MQKSVFLERNIYHEIEGYTDYYLYIDTYNNDSYDVYSFKNFNKYPKGYKLTAKKNKKKEFYYEMTNDAGQPVKITIDQIVDIINNAKIQVSYTFPPTPVGRRTMIVPSDKFDYEKTPKARKRKKPNRADEIHTPSLFKNLTIIEPFEIIDKDKFYNG